MTPERSVALQNIFLALVVGLAIPPAIGFWGGFWVTQDSAARKANAAGLAIRTGICVAQFTAAPKIQERLKELKQLEYSSKATYLEKGGWARMPGEEKAQDAVSQGCVEKLDALAQK